MKIKIKNKNNNAFYKCILGTPLTNNLNEQLDNINVKLENLTSRINIEPFDEIELLDESGMFEPRYFCVDTWQCVETCVAPYKYDYEISLFSQTKLLENIPLPNLSITSQKVDGSTTNRTIYEYLEMYLNEYGEKIRLQPTVGSMRWELRFKFNTVSTANHPSVQAKFIQKCPEMQWNQPTLRDVLNDLMMVQNCIVIVKNGIIDYIDLSQKNRNIDAVESTRRDITTQTLTLPQEVGQSAHTQIYRRIDEGQSIGEISVDIVSGATTATYTTNHDGNQWYINVYATGVGASGCVLTLKYSVLTYSRLRDIILTHQYSQSSEDYISELQMDMQNVMQTGIDGVNNITTTAEYLTVTSNSYLVTDSNFYLQTKYPILRIKHLWIMMPYRVKNSSEQYYSRTMYLDLCHLASYNPATGYYRDEDYNFVYEEKEYNQLPIEYDGAQLFINLQNIFGKQNYALYYTRGGNQISGFTNSTKNLVWFTQPAWRYLIYYLRYLCCVYDRDAGESVAVPFPFSTDTSYWADNEHFAMMFKVEYETTADSLFRAGKSNVQTNSKVVIDNQTNSYVDAYAQGIFEYMKANRLGNEMTMLNARVSRPSVSQEYSLLQVGDYYKDANGEDNVIFQTQYQIYDNHVEINAYATKNYIMQNYFTGVKAKIRSWKFESGSEALLRHDLIKKYVEFDFVSRTDLTKTALGGDDLKIDTREFAYSLNPTLQGFRNLKYCVLKSKTDSDDYTPSGIFYYLTDLTTRLIGNSVVSTFGFDDNITINKSVATSQVPSTSLVQRANTDRRIEGNVSNLSLWGTGGIPLKMNSYVDSDGETNGYLFYLLYDRYDNDTGEPTSELNRNGKKWNTSEKQTFLRQLIYTSFKVPTTSQLTFYDSGVGGIDYRVVEGRFEGLKDNKEISKLSIQYELCSNTPDIAFTKEYLKRIRLVSNKYYGNDEHMVAYIGEKYKDSRNPVLPDELEEVSCLITIGGGTNNSYVPITIDFYTDENYTTRKNISLTANQSLYLCSKNNDTEAKALLLAFNKVLTNVNTFTLYLNNLQQRNKSVYDEDGYIVRTI